MPWQLPYPANLISAWMIDASRSVILRGGGWNELWLHAIVLWTMAILSLVFSLLRMQKRL